MCKLCHGVVGEYNRGLKYCSPFPIAVCFYCCCRCRTLMILSILDQILCIYLYVLFLSVVGYINCCPQYLIAVFVISVKPVWFYVKLST